MKEINAKTVDQGLMLAHPRGLCAITPAIDTPEAFRELLEKIQALNIKVGDSDLISLQLHRLVSSSMWGSMFDFGSLGVRPMTAT